MKIFRQIAFIVRSEALYLRRFPRLLISAAVVVLVPALYCVVYLTSVWDPEAKTAALPVALVNLDEGVQYRENTFNVGWDIANRLKDSGRFGFIVNNDEQNARALVREGKLAFALIIPRGFSASAVPGAEAGGAKVVIYTSQGNNFETANIAKHFAESLGREINESLNERRWALVLRSAAGSQRGVDQLHEAVEQLRLGARELEVGSKQTATGMHTLASGANRVNEGTSQMTTGVKQLGAGLKAMDAARPSNADLNRLTNGAQALEDGSAELGRGMGELLKGSQRLSQVASSFRDEAKDSLFVTSSTIENLSNFADGMAQLDTGLKAAHTAQGKLATGASKLSDGVDALAVGVRSMGSGIRTMASKTPEDALLDALAKGANDVATGSIVLVEATYKVNHGAQRMSSGIELLAGALPKEVDSIGGSAQGLANSVEPVLEIDAPVQNSGSGFAANVIPGALWLGAGVAAFLIHIRVLPRHAQFFMRPAKVLGKIFWPACIALLQTAVVLVTTLFVLKIHIMHPWAFALTLAMASNTFLLIVFTLSKTLGDAGKGISMFLLAVQLSSSGGILPVELSGGLFAQISPWLPLTWVVNSIKASMFGAYGGAWQLPLLQLGLAALGAAAIACWAGTWRYAPSSDTLHSSVDF